MEKVVKDFQEFKKSLADFKLVESQGRPTWTQTTPDFNRIQFEHQDFTHHFFIGDMYTAASLSTLLECHISTIVNCTDDPDLNRIFDHLDLFTYHNVPVQDDKASSNLMLDILTESDLLEQISKDIVAKRNVLFHCHAGVSRSVTVAMVTLMSCFDKSRKESYDILHSQRPNMYTFSKGNFEKVLDYYDPSGPKNVKTPKA